MEFTISKVKGNLSIVYAVKVIFSDMRKFHIDNFPCKVANNNSNNVLL